MLKLKVEGKRCKGTTREKEETEKKRMKAEIVVMFMDRTEPPVHDYRKHVMFWTV